MRVILAASMLPLLANAFDCGRSEPPAPTATTATVQTSAAAPIATATHGGKIAVVGNASLELVVKADGVVEAYPVAAPSPTGAAAAAATVTVIPPTATVDVVVETATGPSAPVRMAWNPEGRFEGRLVGNAPRPGAAKVDVAIAGQAATHAQIDGQPVVVVPARGGTIVEVGAARLEVVVGSNGVVQAVPIYPTVEASPALPAAANVTVDVGLEVDAAAAPVPANVNANANANASIALTYRPALGLYEGRAPLGRRVATGPCVVRVANAAANVEARAPRVEVVPASYLVVEGPQFGGTVVELEGGAKVEVAADASGRVIARPIATSVLTPRIERGAQVSVDVAVVGGTPATVPLTWENDDIGFSGRAEGRVRFANGPVAVAVIHPGKPVVRGRVDAFVIVPQPALDARLTIIARDRGNSANAPGIVRGRGEVVAPAPAPAPAANVRAGVRVGVVAPPPPQVRVEVAVPRPPPPPQVRVGVSVGGSATVGGGGGIRLGGSR